MDSFELRDKAATLFEKMRRDDPCYGLVDATEEVALARIEELEKALCEIMEIHWPDGNWYAIAKKALDSPADSQDSDAS